MDLPTTIARSWWCGVPREGRWSRPAERATLAIFVALLTVGCVPEIPEPVVTSTTSPEVAAIEAARDVLAEPTTALAAVAVDAARRVDFIRHEVARGPAMRQATMDLSDVVTQLEEQATALEVAVAAVDGSLGPTRDAASTLVAEGRTVAETVSAEIDALQPVLDIDDRMAEVVGAWDDRGGSRSEAPQRLTALVAQAEDVLREARRLSLRPAACSGVRGNRLRWARLLLSRSEHLRDLAVAADGPAYDTLRARFDVAPYGEDRVAADAESRACWADRSGLLAVEGEVRTHVAAIEQALGG